MLEVIGKQALDAKKDISKLTTNQKNSFLYKLADELENQAQLIIEANDVDVISGRAKGLPEPLIDRLKLDENRIRQIAQGVREVAALDDPIGEVLGMKRRPNGLLIGQKRVPLGTVGVIYEARPNVTIDIFSLCFKTNNGMIFKGGRDAFHTNAYLVGLIQDLLEDSGYNPNLVQLIEDNSREATQEMMKMNKVLDVLIPRGGSGLIQSVVENATVPVIETGTGNCHIFVDKDADLDQAIDIILNAKTQRVGVCNALESLLIHEDIVEEFLPKVAEKLTEKEVELRIEPSLLPLWSKGIPATESDWGQEYLDYILSIKSVKDIDEAIDHINKYSTGHSEAILTSSYENAQRFLDEIDSAAVYVNASTRFTDGFEFGFGAEVGISTQKLHARGPMGLEALTTTKFIILGQGQVR